MDELHQLASLKSTPLSLSNMFRYAKAEDVIQRLRNAQFLHRELPIRIAQRAVDLLTLPHGLNQTKDVQTIAQTYLKYIQKFREFPEPKTMAQEEKFTDMLETLVLDRTSIPMAIAQGVESLYDNRKEELLDVHRLHEMEEALYRFFTARVGLRFLTEHHVLSSPHPSQRQNKANFRRLQSWIRESDEESDPGEGSFCGLLQEDCNPADEVQRVAAQVIAQTRETYGISPEIEIVDCTREQDKDGKFTYVPTHLQYMLAELLKNSCRATVRRYALLRSQKDVSCVYCKMCFLIVFLFHVIVCVFLG
jgi:pyruvate dehydrogenase kinase 2/3/4